MLPQVLFPNEAIALLLARMIAIFGPVDADMLQQGLETHKYFTKEYDLYYINEVSYMSRYLKLNFKIFLYDVDLASEVLEDFQ